MSVGRITTRVIGSGSGVIGPSVGIPSSGGGPLPTDLSGLVLWLDPFEPGVTLYQWDDKSGQGNHFTAPGGASGMPTFSGGIATFTSAQYVESVTGGAFGALTAGEVFWKGFSDTQAITQGMPFDIDYQSSTDHYPYWGSADDIYCGFGTNTRYNFSDGGFDKTAMHKINIWVATNDWSFQQDEGVVYSRGATTTPSFSLTTKSRVGNSSWNWAGQMKTLILYNRKLSTEERALVNTYVDTL